MTYEEMLAEARESASKIADTVYLRQRFFMPREELIRLLITAYGNGGTAMARRSVKAFAPDKLGDYDRMLQHGELQPDAG